MLVEQVELMEELVATMLMAIHIGELDKAQLHMSLVVHLAHYILQVEQEALAVMFGKTLTITALCVLLPQLVQ
jgi:hypothetical protein